MKMKKIIYVLTALGLVLGVGLAFADESVPLGYAGRDNGVTFIGTVGTNEAIQCSSEGGMGAGGMAEGEAYKDVGRIDMYETPNGVSFSTEAPGPICAWAPGLGRELELHNGVSFAGK
jgi:hypothetical protein